ncbi:hypothetical protein Y1Q_0008818 [Alligator mississippiensis]|uniref:Reverse transcriptase RNase H-like domain-containing protein n=1 Tax=Alligator mississippiensis TaxID=8496 RepID=A0A151NA21_ALLMI|nr:hypothetical protein Y1Q_0008818 [Alligator mississippiensis]
MTAIEVLGQNLQALTQIVSSQQQMFDQQQEWFRRGQVSFKMLQMTKEDDPKAYIEAFECHTLMTGLPQEHWASQLGTLVVGVVQAAYRAIPREEAQDYERVKQAILYQLEISPDYYRHLFRVLLQLLRDLLDKWVSPVGSDREDLADQVILEQFQMDASDTAVGAVLTQEEEGIERPIAYASRKLTPAEKRCNSSNSGEARESQMNKADNSPNVPQKEEKDPKK